jgi:RNA polymerase sigma-70 factor (ECF subfamily)
VDPEDVVQSVFRSFFSRQAKGQFELENRDNLWSLLTVMALRKMMRHMRLERRAAAGKTQVDLEIESIVDRIPSDEPTPEFVARFQELLDHLMHALGDENLRYIVRCTMEGQTTDEIARALGMSRSSVTRKLHLIRKIWSQESPE